MPLRRVVITENAHRPNDLDTGSIGRNDDYALLAVFIGVVGIALAEDEMQGASWVTSTADPPFVTVDDNFITLLTNGGTDVGGVR